MKILFVFNHPAPYKVNLFNELANSLDLHVIFERKKAKDRPDSFYANNEYNFNVRFLKRGSFGNENSNTGELKRFIAENYLRYDLIIMNGYSTFSEMRAIHYMKRHKIPFVLYINGGVIKKENFIKSKIKKYFIGSAFKYLSPCEEADEYLRHYGVNERDIYHYPYSTFFKKDVLSSPLTKESKKLIQKKYNLPSSPLFVTAGQFIERKNNLSLISLFKDRKENLLLIGEGPLEDKYYRYIKDNNLTNVHIMRFLPHDELFKVLQGCDCFVTLSKEDIYGHTTNEALANGLPVISSNRVVSSRHLIKDGYNGYIVSLDGKEEILRAFSLINAKMSANAIKTAKENMIEKTAKSHVAIFNEVLKCK